MKALPFGRAFILLVWSKKLLLVVIVETFVYNMVAFPALFGHLFHFCVLPTFKGDIHN